MSVGSFCHDKHHHLTRRLTLDHSCFGRDHAHQRIHLYRSKAHAFAPQSVFT